MGDIKIDLGDGAYLTISSLKIKEIVSERYGIKSPFKRTAKKRKYVKSGKYKKRNISKKQRLAISLGQKRRWKEIRKTAKKRKYVKSGKYKRKRVFTKRDIKIIKSNYGFVKNSITAKEINKTPRQVWDKTRELIKKGEIKKRK